MSNHLAIATVTGVLGARIRSHLVGAGMAFDVTLSHPLDADTNGAFLHLYSVLPNPGLRNETLPERSGDGTARVPPRLAIDLYYQLTFVGAAGTYDPERMAGAVMTGLHAFPRLSPEEISAFVATQPAGTPLAASDLADQADAVRISPLSADVEELSRLWGMTQRSFHRLTVLYRASPVLLDAEVPTASGLPVTTPTVTAYSLQAPRITSVSSSARSLPVVQHGETLIISGQALVGHQTEIALGLTRVEPDAATDTELRLDFGTPSGLAAGVYPVQVRHRVELENGDTRDGAASNTVPVALAPLITPGSLSLTTILGPVGGHRVHLVPLPVPGTDQAVELTLIEMGGGGRHSSTTWATENGGTGTVFDFPTLPAGQYLVRLAVDGAESLLTTDGAGAFDGPTIAVP